MRKLRGLNITINNNLLKEQSNVFALKMDVKGLKAIDGWLQKSRSNPITKIQVYPWFELQKIVWRNWTANTTSANEWKEHDLKALLNEYALEDVINSDETGLFLRCCRKKYLT